MLYECFRGHLQDFPEARREFLARRWPRPAVWPMPGGRSPFAELKTLGELTKIAWEYDVQV